MGEGAEFGAVIDDLLKQGPEMLREKTESDENSDSSAGKPESVIGGLSGGVGGNSAIICPSGNRVYVHPISGDLQQCSQQLGFYNQTTCPGGTVCERFPILIPGFQDYCCWGNDTSDSEAIIIGSTKGSVVEPNPDVDSSSGDNRPGVISGGSTESPRPSSSRSTDNDEDEWIVTTVIPKTRKTRRPRPRSRKTTTPPRRGPKCRNPEDAALIDFGNRLRDCYYQQCPYSYRCEFNSDIRRYICCGRERDVYPPPGLPPLPEPKPLVPRPFRPRVPPPYMFGEEEENPLVPHGLLENTNDNEEEQVSVENCPAGQEHRGLLGAVTFCEPHNLNLVCPSSHPYCVHSGTFGAPVCCAQSETWAME